MQSAQASDSRASSKRPLRESQSWHSGTQARISRVNSAAVTVGNRASHERVDRDEEGRRDHDTADLLGSQIQRT
jgi:hypothetical protein